MFYCPLNYFPCGNNFLELPLILSLNIPRHIGITCSHDIQLLGFTEASTKGYTPTVYLRIIDKAGALSVHSVTCKTKDAPLKGFTTDESLSIPLYCRTVTGVTYQPLITRQIQPRVVLCQILQSRLPSIGRDLTFYVFPKINGQGKTSFC